MRSTKILICEDCTVVFQVYGMNYKKQYHCPNCGDSVAVSYYQAERFADKTTKIRWKPEELEVLEQCIKGKLQPYQAAIILGRSINSVTKKVLRLKKMKS